MTEHDTAPLRCAPAPDVWMAAMRRGDFATAWRISDTVLAERRGEPCWHRPRHLQHVWTGAPLAGRRVLVRCYHGLGDTLQFIRLAAPLRRIASRVTVWVQPPLLPLIATAPGVDAVLPLHDGTPEADYDADIEVMELAHALRVEPDDLADRVPYLFPPGRDRDSKSPPPPTPPCHAPRAWQEGSRSASPRSSEEGRSVSTPLPPFALANGREGSAVGGSGLAPRESTPSLRVGFVWQAGSWDAARSIPTALIALLFERLIRHTAIAPFILQRGLTPGTINDLTATDIGSDDILITAARMRDLDLVVSVDTMAAHLAGALGVRCVTLLKDECDWRWMALRNDSPWYPTMRLVRVPPRGTWDDALAALEDLLMSPDRAIPEQSPGGGVGPTYIRSGPPRPRTGGRNRTT